MERLGVGGVLPVAPYFDAKESSSNRKQLELQVEDPTAGCSSWQVSEI